MTEDHDTYMRQALDEAVKSGAEGNRAIGAVAVRNGEVVGRSGNRRESATDPTGHAETTVLRAAALAVGLEGLKDCSLYTTLEPCPMCCGAVVANGVPRLVVGGRHPAEERRWGDYTVERLLEMTGWARSNQVIVGVLADECMAVLREWDARNGIRR